MSHAASPYAVDLICCCAVMLAGMALMLLLRCRTQRGLISVLQAQLCRLRAEHDCVRGQERQRIARDIHDDLGQHLLALALEASALGASVPAARLQATEIESHVKLALRSLRSVIRDLRPEALEDGLRCAVELQLERFSSLNGIRCQFRAEPAVFGGDGRHTAAIEVVLYRILQESLSNIARHARATQVWIAVFRGDGSLGMTVRDNGIGLPCDGAARERDSAAQDRSADSGHGISGMTQRVRDAGGLLHISSTPGQGTALLLSFPLDVALHQAEPASPAAQ